MIAIAFMERVEWTDDVSLARNWVVVLKERPLLPTLSYFSSERDGCGGCHEFLAHAQCHASLERVLFVVLMLEAASLSLPPLSLFLSLNVSPSPPPPPSLALLSFAVRFFLSFDAHSKVKRVSFVDEREGEGERERDQTLCSMECVFANVFSGHFLMSVTFGMYCDTPSFFPPLSISSSSSSPDGSCVRCGKMCHTSFKLPHPSFLVTPDPSEICEYMGDIEKDVSLGTFTEFGWESQISLLRNISLGFAKHSNPHLSAESHPFIMCPFALVSKEIENSFSQLSTIAHSLSSSLSPSSSLPPLFHPFLGHLNFQISPRIRQFSTSLCLIPLAEMCDDDRDLKVFVKGMITILFMDPIAVHGADDTEYGKMKETNGSEREREKRDERERREVESAAADLFAEWIVCHSQSHSRLCLNGILESMAPLLLPSPSSLSPISSLSLSPHSLPSSNHSLPLSPTSLSVSPSPSPTFPTSLPESFGEWNPFDFPPSSTSSSSPSPSLLETFSTKLSASIEQWE